MIYEVTPWGDFRIETSFTRLVLSANYVKLPAQKKDQVIYVVVHAWLVHNICIMIMRVTLRSTKPD